MTVVIEEFDHIAESVKERRKRTGKSVDELAQKAGVSRQLWYNLEKGDGKATFSLEKIEAINRVLKQELAASIVEPEIDQIIAPLKKVS